MEQSLVPVWEAVVVVVLLVVLAAVLVVVLTVVLVVVEGSGKPHDDPTAAGAILKCKLSRIKIDHHNTI